MYTEEPVKIMIGRKKYYVPRCFPSSRYCGIIMVRNGVGHVKPLFAFV